MSAVLTLFNAKQFTEPEPSDVQKLCIIGAWSCSLCGWRQRRVLGCLIWSLPRLKTRSTTFSVANNCAMTRCHALINITISHLNDRTLIHYNLQHYFLHFGGTSPIGTAHCFVVWGHTQILIKTQNHVKILCRLEVNLDYKIYVSFNLRILGRFCWI